MFLWWPSTKVVLDTNDPMGWHAVKPELIKIVQAIMMRQKNMPSPHLFRIHSHPLAGQGLFSLYTVTEIR